MKRLAFFLVAGVSALAAASGPAAPAPTPVAAGEAGVKRIRVPGLQRSITVARDRWGVVHISAENSHDLFFAQGFVAAQDRLFQMEMWKRAGQGRLSEVLGPKMLQRDITARLLRYRGAADAEYASYARDARAILTAFTDGINAWIASRKPPGGPGWGEEFQSAGFAPEPWKPE